MKYVFDNLFSHRHNLVKNTPLVKKEVINQDIINAIGSCYDIVCERLRTVLKTNYSGLRLFAQEDIEREIWIHFANNRLSDFYNYGQYRLIVNELLTQLRLQWNRVLDLVECICKWIEANSYEYKYLISILEEFESNINIEFQRLDYGYRIVNHCVTDITSDIEIETINEAINNSNDNVSSHLRSAIQHYTTRPNPDVRNCIKESISAVEAVCRELTGDDTLGKSLNHLEKKGVIIHKMLKEAFTKFYVYTNDGDSGIRHALMDKDQTYVPTKDEAYYMLVSCSAFVNYLRMKAAL